MFRGFLLGDSGVFCIHVATHPSLLADDQAKHALFSVMTAQLSVSTGRRQRIDAAIVFSHICRRNARQQNS